MSELALDFLRLFAAGGFAVASLTMLRVAWRVATWSRRDLQRWVHSSTPTVGEKTP